MSRLAFLAPLLVATVVACSTAGSTESTTTTPTTPVSTTTASGGNTTTTSVVTTSTTDGSTTTTPTTATTTTTDTTTTVATTTTTTQPTTTTAPPSARQLTITIAGFQFSGDANGRVGDTVRVVNTDVVSHTWTAKGGAFDSGSLGTGQEFFYTFDQPGTYEFFCVPHPGMVGSITITG